MKYLAQRTVELHAIQINQMIVGRSDITVEDEWHRNFWTTKVGGRELDTMTNNRDYMHLSWALQSRDKKNSEQRIVVFKP